MKNQANLTQEEQTLDLYLSQYKICVKQKWILENRKRKILEEMGWEKKGEEKKTERYVAICFRIDEIESRIEEQIEQSAKVLADILDVLDFLPDNSIKKSILEYKYIDGYSWNKICFQTHITKTPAIRQWKKALGELLGFKKVQKIMEEFRKKAK